MIETGMTERYGHEHDRDHKMNDLAAVAAAKKVQEIQPATDILKP